MISYPFLHLTCLVVSQCCVRPYLISHFSQNLDQKSTRAAASINRPLDPFPRAYRQRYSNVQAIVGLRGLAHLDEFNARSRAHAARYSQGLADCRAIKTPRISSDIEHVYYQYCIYASDPRRASRRAIRRGVDFETTHVDVCSSLDLFKEYAAICPGAESTESALQLPVYSRLRDSDVERVLAVVRRVTCDLAPLGEESVVASAVTQNAVTVSGNGAR